MASRCIDCDGPSGTVRLDGAQVSLARCESCGLVFNSNWASPYDDSMYEYYAERMRWNRDEVFRPINRTRLQQILWSLSQRTGGRRLLDVGCGVGTAVDAAIGDGWDALGIDLSGDAVRVAQRFGLPCKRLDVFDESLDPRSFDVVYMSEFIEHVPSPTRFLRRASQLLAPRGVIYLTTPNFNSLGRRVLGSEWRPLHPEHLSYFTRETLSTVVKQAGLQADYLRTENVSVPAVRRLLRRASGDRAEGRAQEQEIRQAVSMSRSGRVVRPVVNAALSATALGETLKAVLRPC